MMVLDGKKVAEYRRAMVGEKVEKMRRTQDRVPGLAVVLVGEDPASQVYVANKAKACEAVGIKSWIHRLPAQASAAEVKKVIDTLNTDPQVHGLLVQLPLPKHLDTDEVLSWVNPAKDVDGLSVENMGLMWADRPRAIPCTPNGVMAILDYYQIPVTGKHAVVVGRSQIVGKPMALLLQKANATVTICHSKTPDVSYFTKQADIVVVAAGKERFLGREDFKKDAVVIDVGMHRPKNGKLCGDVRFEELVGWVKAATPVPGGVGPMTITMLLENTLKLAGG